MDASAAASRTYYSAPAPMSDLSRHRDPVGTLPRSVSDLCRVVQGVVMHPFLAHLYDVAEGTVRLEELEIRTAADMVTQIMKLDPRPLVEPRPPERRFVGNCRQAGATGDLDPGVAN